MTPPLNVSRETMDRLKALENLVLKWNPKINLISKEDSAHVWDRHIADSAQIAEHIVFPAKWADFGSGGGFPALILAVIAKDAAPATEFSLVESDRRKCAFLLSATAELGLNCRVLAKRIEDVEPLSADVISARALAALPKLFEFSEPHAKPETTFIFPKGKSHGEEISAARRDWSFQSEIIPSITNSEAAILKIWNLKRGNGSS